MSLKLIKGKPVADRLTEINIEKVACYRKFGVTPKLAILRVGEREDDLSYERGALKRMEKTGIEVEVRALPADIDEEGYIEALKALNEDSGVHGILCFRPLPKHISEDRIKHIIDPEKDVDCFNPQNMARLLENDKSALEPCTPKAVMEILSYYDIDPKSKRVTLVGRSKVVGKPLMLMLINANATVKVCHTKTLDLKEEVRDSDIVIASAGSAEMIKSDWIGDNAVVIDVGINFTDDGRMCGDVDLSGLEKRNERGEINNITITPVPGGVGAVTTSVLAANLLKACARQSRVVSEDRHMHSHYCPHGSGDGFEKYIEAAISRGLKGISFTEHMPFPEGFEDPSPKKDSSMSMDNIRLYFKEEQYYKEKYEGIIDIKKGLEVDYLEGLEKETEKILNSVGDELEDSILSVHTLLIDGEYLVLDFSSEYFGEIVRKAGSLENLYRHYYNTVIKAVKADLGPYKPKRIGHINLITKYIMDYPFDYRKMPELEEAIRLIGEKGYELDFNVSGLRKRACRRAYIDDYIYDLALKYGVKTVFGSDSHTADTVGILP